MTRDLFKIIHSELIQQVQCSENNLKLIYATLMPGNTDDNYYIVKKYSLGKITAYLRNNSRVVSLGILTKDDFEFIKNITEIRNYWCHQCYLDFSYITNDEEREAAFQRVAKRLHYDEFKTHDLLEKTERLKREVIIKYEDAK